MKKQLVVTGLVASLAILGAIPARAFQTKQTATVSAQAVTGGIKSASFSLLLVNTASTGTTQTSIAWSGVNPGDSWKIADQALQLKWSVTDANGGIQFYTDNAVAAAAPQFVDPTPADNTNSDSNPAGLVLVPTVGNTSSAVLPVAWSIKADTATIGTNLIAADPNTGPATGAGNKFQWLFLSDKNTPTITATNTTAFANADPFVTMIKQSGIHGSQGPTEFFADADKLSYVYLQADFTTAAAQSTYKTSRLTVEAFIQ